uniref:GRIP domain-containing protein n=1 Tax=Parastrongyloides trichosuri TaxID=131310 RepID=A0A0N5A774_PARTI
MPENGLGEEIKNVPITENLENISLESNNDKNNEIKKETILEVRIEALQNDYSSLKLVHEEKLKQFEEMKEKAKEIEEIKLKIESDYKKLKESSINKEKEYQNSIQQLTNKMEASINNLNTKLKNADNDKNMAVIRYATKETEVMKLNKENNQLKEDIKVIRKEFEELKENTSQETIDKLKKNIEILQEEIFKEKKEKEKIMNDYSMAEKRIAASHTTIKDMKERIDLALLGNNNISEERDKALEEVKNYKSQIQVLQIKGKELEYQYNEKIKSRDHLYKECIEEMGRLRNENTSLTQKLINYDGENEKTKLMQTLLEEELENYKSENTKVKSELDELKDVKEQIDKYMKVADEAIKAKNISEGEKEEYEKDNIILRNEAETLLNSNKNIQQKAIELMAEIENCHEKRKTLEKEVDDKKKECQELMKEVELMKKEKENKELVDSSKLNELLGVESTLNEKLKEMNKRVQELENEKMVIRKKAEANQKDLRLEVKRLRKQLDSMTDKCSLQSFQLPSSYNGTKSANDVFVNSGQIESSNISATISRTSSINSFETAAGYRSGSTTNTQTSSPNKDDASEIDNNDKNTQIYGDIKNSNNSVNVQQAMVDKIVKLQRSLAKKGEKIEFLEEHVKQCIEELKKKSRIIQYYALREEAAMLKPAQESLEEILSLCPTVQVAIKLKESTTPLFGTWFGSKQKEKSNLAISAEINARLQALVEDLLLKNMEFKELIDKLEGKIAIIEREKRQLEVAATH